MFFRTVNRSCIVVYPRHINVRARCHSTIYYEKLRFLLAISLIQKIGLICITVRTVVSSTDSPVLAMSLFRIMNFSQKYEKINWLFHCQKAVARPKKVIKPRVVKHVKSMLGGHVWKKKTILKLLLTVLLQ